MKIHANQVFVLHMFCSRDAKALTWTLAQRGHEKSRVWSRRLRSSVVALPADAGPEDVAYALEQVALALRESHT